jgi:hypothetical protein
MVVISDLDTYRAANLLIKERGAKPLLEAGRPDA